MTSRTRRVADPPVLLVEDKDSLRTMLRLALEAQGHVVVEARDQTEAVAALLATRPAVVLSDLRLPAGDGFGVLRAAKELDPELPVIVMTAFGGVPDAVHAMKEGALDFLQKPVDPDHLLLMVERALAQRRMATENILLKEELSQRRGAPQIAHHVQAFVLVGRQHHHQQFRLYLTDALFGFVESGGDRSLAVQLRLQHAPQLAADGVQHVHANH